MRASRSSLSGSPPTSVAAAATISTSAVSGGAEATAPTVPAGQPSQPGRSLTVSRMCARRAIAWGSGYLEAPVCRRFLGVSGRPPGGEHRRDLGDIVDLASGDCNHKLISRVVVRVELHSVL